MDLSKYYTDRGFIYFHHCRAVLRMMWEGSGDWAGRVSPVLQRTAIRLFISLRIFLRFCWIFAESSLLAGCFVLGNKVFIAVATSNRIWETALLCMGELTSTGQTNRELYTGFVFTGLTGVQMAMMDSEIDKCMMMKVTVHEQSAHCWFFVLIQQIFYLKPQCQHWFYSKKILLFTNRVDFSCQ